MRGFKNPWWVVFGCALAQVVGQGPMMQFTFGVFLKPVVAEFHSSRGAASLALTVGMATTALSVPFTGRLLDRIGVRRTVLASIVLFAASLVALATFARSLTAFTVLFGIVGIAASGDAPLSFVSRERGDE